MRTGWLLGVVVLAAAGACGPDLPFPNRTGMAGIAGFAGAGGTGGGGDDGGMGEAGGSSGPSLYRWDDVAVRVVDGNLRHRQRPVFRMTDQTGASTLSAALQFPSMMALRFPSDGAFVTAHYDCTGPNLYRLSLYSCRPVPHRQPGDGHRLPDGRSSAPGTSGNFVTSAGVSCAIDRTTATASIDLPPTPGHARREREIHARMRGWRQDPIEVRRGLRAPGHVHLHDLLNG